MPARLTSDSLRPDGAGCGGESAGSMLPGAEHGGLGVEKHVKDIQCNPQNVGLGLLHTCGSPAAPEADACFLGSMYKEVFTYTLV